MPWHPTCLHPLIHPLSLPLIHPLSLSIPPAIYPTPLPTFPYPPNPLTIYPLTPPQEGYIHLENRNSAAAFKITYQVPPPPPPPPTPTTYYNLSKSPTRCHPHHHPLPPPPPTTTFQSHLPDATPTTTPSHHHLLQPFKVTYQVPPPPPQHPNTILLHVPFHMCMFVFTRKLMKPIIITLCLFTLSYMCILYVCSFLHVFPPLFTIMPLYPPLAL